MATYTASDATKRRMIDAAGELAAEFGLGKVSTRAVAERSGENIGSIHYHFGGKAGLLEAMVREALALYDKEAAFEAVGRLSEASTPEELAGAIRLVVASEITGLFRSGRPDWHAQVIYQLLQRDDAPYEMIRTELLDPSLDCLERLFRLIDPSLEAEENLLLACAMKMPIFAHASYRKAMLKRLGVTHYSETYLNKMEDLLVRQTQLLLGLPTDKELVEDV